MNRPGAALTALAAVTGVLCTGVPLLPLQAFLVIIVAAAIGARTQTSPVLGAVIAFGAALAQRPDADWKVVAGIALGALAITKWYAAAIVIATFLFFFG